MPDKKYYKKASTKYAILFTKIQNVKGNIIMLKFQDNSTTIIETFEDFILTTCVIIDDLSHQLTSSDITRQYHSLNTKRAPQYNCSYCEVRYYSVWTLSCFHMNLYKSFPKFPKILRQGNSL